MTPWQVVGLEVEDVDLLKPQLFGVCVCVPHALTQLFVQDLINAEVMRSTPKELRLEQITGLLSTTRHY